MRMHRFDPALRNVPVVGQGTWFIDEGERNEAIAALRLGLDLGLTHQYRGILRLGRSRRDRR
jgi:diketogulonate reductase-like aldo/keto reductase